MNDTPSLKPYLLRFLLIYLAATALVVVIPFLINIKPPTSMGIIMLMIAAMVSGQKFVKEQSRAFTQSEKWKMIWWSLFLVYGLSIALISIVLITPYGQGVDGTLFKVINSIGITVFLIAMAIVTLGYIGVLNLSYGWLTNKFYKQSQE